MAVRPEIVQPESVSTPAKPKRKRTASVPKPAFFVIQILDEHGEPTAFDKKRVRLVLVERNAEAVMEMMDNAKYPNAFYLRGIVPVTRSAAPRSAATPASPQQAA